MLFLFWQLGQHIIYTILSLCVVLDLEIWTCTIGGISLFKNVKNACNHLTDFNFNLQRTTAAYIAPEWTYEEVDDKTNIVIKSMIGRL